MKVAIVGAGIAGLSCALELEKHGIKPIIFEQRHRIGSPSPFAPVMFNFVFRPIKDLLQELKLQYGIEIKPISKINLLHMHGPNTKYTVTGNLGFSILRGQEETSLESQLAARLKSPIRFETPVKPKELLKKFDYLVIAEGTKDYAKELSIWHGTFRSWTRGATILGNFNPTEISYWFNTRYAHSGFAYLTPLDTQRASLVLSVAYSTQDDLPKYWQAFLNQENLIVEDIMQWDIAIEQGLVYPHRVGNTFFIGNSGGFVGSWLGTGIFPCIASGVEAARAIATGKNYERNVKHLQNVMEQQARLRHLWDGFNNRSIDWALKVMGSPAVKHPIYHTNLNVMKAIDPLIKYWLNQIPENQKPIH